MHSTISLATLPLLFLLPILTKSSTITTNNYAGIRLNAETPETFIKIQGTFTVPTVSLPPGATVDGSTIYRAAAWVGFDDSIRGQKQAILQSGCVFLTKGTGQQTNRCWKQWFPGPQSPIDGFGPSTGDSVQVVCNVGDRDQDGNAVTGTCTLTNQNTGEEVSVDLTAPSADNSVTGQRVEWVVEDPGTPNGLAPFAQFDQIPFSSCFATVLNGGLQDLSYDGVDQFELDQGGEQVAAATVQSASDFVVDYTASQ